MFMHTAPVASAAAVRPGRPLTEIEFCAWVAQAAPGDRLEYHRGFLALDIVPMFARLSEPERAELARLGSRAFWAAEQGLVHLAQKRLGPDQFAYLAVARPKPKAAAVSLSTLLLDAGPACAAPEPALQAAA